VLVQRLANPRRLRVRAVSGAFAASFAFAVASTGCVSKVNFDRVVADAAKAQAEADQKQKDAEAKEKDDQTQIATLQQGLAAAEAASQECDAKLSDLSTSSHNLQAQLDEATAINQQLRDELGRLGKDVDKILADRGTLSKALDDAKLRLDELRKAQAAAEGHTQLFREFERRFQALVTAGQLKVESRRGRLVMEVAGDSLFDANHADLRKAGKGTLMEIAHALQTTASPASPRRFLVTANVDDAPVKSKTFDSTWELTAARAVAVVQYLVSLGVPANSLTAAGAGSFDPVVPGETPEARGRNRRVEIDLLPSADETLSGASAGATAPVYQPAIPAAPKPL
jgi:chemotaxis protein MotB